MNTLWTFGDSFTSDLDYNNLHNNYKNYFDITKTNTLETWPTVLGKLLNFDVKNLAKGGDSNYDTFQLICDNSNLFRENDIVIISWGLIGKFRVSHNNQFVSIYPDKSNINDIGFLSKKTLIEIIDNRYIIFDEKRDRYSEEIHIWEKGIRTLAKSKKFKVFFWTSEEQRFLVDRKSKYFSRENYLFPEINKPIVHHLKNDLNCKTIFDETNGLVPDTHFGNEGHKLIGEIFYNIISNG